MLYTSPRDRLVQVGDRFRLSAGTIQYTAVEIVPTAAHDHGQVIATHPTGRRVRIPLDAVLIHLPTPKESVMPRIVPLALALLVVVLGIAAPPAAAEPIHVDGRGHVQDRGWLPWVADSQVIGTTGRSLRLEAIELRGGVGEVSAHVQDRGWLPSVPSGTIAGTTGKSLRLEAVRVRSDVPGWQIQCRAHVQDRGWLPWVSDSQVCGTTGRSLRLEAVQLRLIAQEA